MQKLLRQFLCGLSLMACIPFSHAATYHLSENNDLIGKLQYTLAKQDDTLTSLGEQYGLGFNAMVQANSGIDQLDTISPQTYVQIPTLHLLPPGPHQGIVVNLAEMRIYFFPMIKL